MTQTILSRFVVLALVAVAIGGCSQFSGHQTPQTAQAPQATVQQAASVSPAPPQGSAGMTVHKDPVTGRFVPAPRDTSAAPLSKELINAMSMSQEGLVEVPSPGGGFMVDLRGRFQQAATATINADGSVTVQCGQHEHREKE